MLINKNIDTYLDNFKISGLEYLFVKEGWNKKEYILTAQLKQPYFSGFWNKILNLFLKNRR